jgi:hypothetical protein
MIALTALFFPFCGQTVLSAREEPEIITISPRENSEENGHFPTIPGQLFVSVPVRLPLSF